GPSPPRPYTLHLHDALPIWYGGPHTAFAVQTDAIGHILAEIRPQPAFAELSFCIDGEGGESMRQGFGDDQCASVWRDHGTVGARSEEHTSELQSRENLVCRL